MTARIIKGWEREKGESKPLFRKVDKSRSRQKCHGSLALIVCHTNDSQVVVVVPRDAGYYPCILMLMLPWDLIVKAALYSTHQNESLCPL